MNKKLALMVIALYSTAEVTARGFGGGFLTGALVGTGVTLAATSGNRQPRSDAYYISQQINTLEQRITQLRRRLRRAKSSAERSSIQAQISANQQRVDDLRDSL